MKVHTDLFVSFVDNDFQPSKHFLQLSTKRRICLLCIQLLDSSTVDGVNAAMASEAFSEGSICQKGRGGDLGGTQKRREAGDSELHWSRRSERNEGGRVGAKDDKQPQSRTDIDSQLDAKPESRCAQSGSGLGMHPSSKDSFPGQQPQTDENLLFVRLRSIRPTVVLPRPSHVGVSRLLRQETSWGT